MGPQGSSARNDFESSGNASAALMVAERDGDREQAGSGSNPENSLTLRSPLAYLPTQLDVYIPVPSFRVSDLIALEVGKVLATEWGSMEDLPLTCGRVQLVWAEFEVVDQRIAIRVTRLV